MDEDTPFSSAPVSEVTECYHLYNTSNFDAFWSIIKASALRDTMSKNEVETFISATPGLCLKQSVLRRMPDVTSLKAWNEATRSKRNKLRMHSESLQQVGAKRARRLSGKNSHASKSRTTKSTIEGKNRKRNVTENHRIRRRNGNKQQVSFYKDDSETNSDGEEISNKIEMRRGVSESTSSESEDNENSSYSDTTSASDSDSDSDSDSNSDSDSDSGAGRKRMSTRDALFCDPRIQASPQLLSSVCRILQVCLANANQNKMNDEVQKDEELSVLEEHKAIYISSLDTSREILSRVPESLLSCAYQV